ncbi:PREDICTED: PC-esterase domain-containing protein 1A isoform X2 [Galeopterus variegatus]|uniref:PC-esterase domain-containing protein 1A isoform X2 n=1 Tax=Galeopterus variegatus TaxID=482537 RepID=A0ABM0QKI1_GALVR|nr:PREDICTED: PC-esterase domain-containing protein 1A isoform X2 [Galeopterus variegatus]
MVFCLENEEPRRPLRSAMVHFQASEVQQLLHNKFVVILGDSIQRTVYKDLVLLLQRDSLLTAAQLKAKGELSFEQDQLVAGGQLGELHNGTKYREVRQFCSGSGHHLVRFYFLTRVYSEYLEGILEELTYGPAPDLVIINSCLWDLSRYGRCSMESYRENLERVFVRMDQVLPDSCLLVWNMAMPLGERITGGFLLPELQPLAGSLRRDVVEGNFYSATLAGDHCFDVLDLHFHFRHAVQHRHRDGVHWDQHAHRHLSHLLLTHVADAWGVELPKRDYPPDESMHPHQRKGCSKGCKAGLRQLSPCKSHLELQKLGTTKRRVDLGWEDELTRGLRTGQRRIIHSREAIGSSQTSGSSWPCPHPLPLLCPLPCLFHILFLSPRHLPCSHPCPRIPLLSQASPSHPMSSSIIIQWRTSQCHPT